MKNVKAVMLLALAIVIGLGAAFYAVQIVSKNGNIASNKVVVAAVDIPLGSKISPQMITTMDWPIGSVPSGAFKEAKGLQERVVKTTVMRGEAILETKLAPAGSQGGLSAVIAEGKRAMTVRVNDVVGVAGFALPGNYVDVLVHAEQENKSGERKQISKMVLERVLVLAVAQQAERDVTQPKVVNAVTLELSLEDSEKLDLARSVGTLSLVLRNQIDDQAVKTAGATKKQLFGQEEVPAKPVVAEKPKPAVKRAAHSPNNSKQEEKICLEVVQQGSRVLNCF